MAKGGQYGACQRARGNARNGFDDGRISDESSGRLCPVFLLLGGLFVFGCNSPAPPTPPAGHAADHDDDHDDGEHPHHETYAAAVEELDGLRLAVKNAMAENNLDAAHEAVHEIAHILEELPALAAKQATAADENVKRAIDELFECFDQIESKAGRRSRKKLRRTFRSHRNRHGDSAGQGENRDEVRKSRLERLRKTQPAVQA